MAIIHSYACLFTIPGGHTFIIAWVLAAPGAGKYARAHLRAGCYLLRTRRTLNESSSATQCWYDFTCVTALLIIPIYHHESYQSYPNMCWNIPIYPNMISQYIIPMYIPIQQNQFLPHTARRCPAAWNGCRLCGCALPASISGTKTGATYHAISRQVYISYTHSTS